MMRDACIKTIDIENILKINPEIEDANKIYAGQQIVIPVAEHKG